MFAFVKFNSLEIGEMGGECEAFLLLFFPFSYDCHEVCSKIGLVGIVAFADYELIHSHRLDGCSYDPFNDGISAHSCAQLFDVPAFRLVKKNAGLRSQSGFDPF